MRSTNLNQLGMERGISSTNGMVEFDAGITTNPRS